jgi:hypothetical protein
MRTRIEQMVFSAAGVMIFVAYAAALFVNFKAV